MKLIKYKINEIGADFADAPFGTSLKTKDYSLAGVPVVQGRNIKNNKFEWNDKLYVDDSKFQSLKKHWCKEGDLVFPKIGTIGVTAIMPKVEGRDTFLLSTNMMKMSIDKKVANLKYVYYYFCQNHIRNFIKTIGGGVAQPIFNYTTLKNFDIFLPSVTTQQKIATILSAYDDLIENNNKRIKILNEIANSVYKKFFVLDANPSWKLTSIKDITTNLDSKRRPLSSMERMKRQGKFPYYGAAKVIDYIDDYLLDGRYLLVAEDGTVITKDGYPVLQLTNGKFWVSNHAHIIQGKGNFSLEYIYLFLSNYKIIGHITGSAQPKLSQQNFNRIQIANPDETTMVMFNNIVKPMMNEIMVLESKNEVLTKTKNLLLPKLISGELDVEGLDIKIRPEIL